MEPRRTPTLEDLARLLATAGGGEHHPESRDTALWLIEESASELYADLVADPGEEPSPLELARLECAAASDDGIAGALPAADWLLAQSEPARSHLARLDRLAAEAGRERFKRDRTSLLEYEDWLDRLLEAVDDWQHPSEILDPTRKHGLDCQALFNLCCFRIEGSEGGARRRLEALRDKLERPAELKRLLPAFKRRFELLQKWLAEVGDVETAAESLEEMGRLLRSAMRSRIAE